MGPDPKRFVVWYEAALFTAVKEIFPQWEIKPCYFYFVKALWRAAAKFGLRKNIGQYIPNSCYLICSMYKYTIFINSRIAVKDYRGSS